MDNRDLEIWVIGHWRSFKLVPFESLGPVFYSPSIATMALSCIISEIKRDICRKSWYFHTPLHSTPPVNGSPSKYWHTVWFEKNSNGGATRGEKNFDDMSSRLDRIPACDRQTDRQLDRRTGWQTDGQTDRQTSCHGIVRAMHTRVAR